MEDVSTNIISEPLIDRVTILIHKSLLEKFLNSLLTLAKLYDLLFQLISLQLEPLCLL